MVTATDVYEAYVDGAFLVLRLGLEESKQFSSLRTDKVRQKVVDLGFNFDTGQFMRYRRGRTTTANKKFGSLSKSMEDQLIRMAWDYRIKKISFNKWAAGVRKLIRVSYEAAYKLGLESSGLGSVYNVDLRPADRTFVQSAVDEEMTYMRALLQAVRQGEVVGDNMERRFKAYVDTLKHQYYAGRVAGSPSNMVIDWICPLDKTTCVSCRFLSDNSPYTSRTLPTTPKAGACRCLNNCRCRLLIRKATPETISRLNRGRTKSYFSRRLKTLKGRR